MINNRICILGTGAWATALGLRLSLNGNTVFLWGINNNEVNDINSGYNKKYFGETKFCSSLSATTDLKIAIGDSKYIIFAVPSVALDEVLDKVKNVISPKTQMIFVNVIKGIDPETNDILSKKIKLKLGSYYHSRLVTLCGPSFAQEVFEQKPTIINATGKSNKIVKLVCELFNSEVFKVIPIKDIVGLQIYSSLKNLLAIAVGLTQGDYNSINTMSAIITMGIEEIQDIAYRMKAKRKSIISFCGIGDIFLTCSSTQSRNFSFGQELLSKGVAKAIKENKKTVEGFEVYKTVKNIINKYKIIAPVFNSIIDVLEERLDPKDFAKRCLELVWEQKLGKQKKR